MDVLEIFQRLDVRERHLVDSQLRSIGDIVCEERSLNARLRPESMFAI